MNARDLLLFYSADQNINVSVYFEKGSFWLTQKTMAELFFVDRSVITKHLKNIFNSNELDKNAECAIFAHSAEDGKNYNIKFYRLESILNVVRKCNFRNRKTSK